MIYIKKEEDVAVAYCDVGTLEAITQSREADLVVSDAEWAKAGFHAYIDNTGKVVLGYPALTLNELKEEKRHRSTRKRRPPSLPDSTIP